MVLRFVTLPLAYAILVDKPEGTNKGSKSECYPKIENGIFATYFIQGFANIDLQQIDGAFNKDGTVIWGWCHR